MQQEYREHAIGEHKYRVGRIEASKGCYLLNLLSRLNTASETEFNQYQNQCLSVCQRWVVDLTASEKSDGSAWMPIIMQGSNRLAFPDLQYDIKTVATLVNFAVLFNFESFIQDDGTLKAELQKALGLPSSDSPR